MRYRLADGELIVCPLVRCTVRKIINGSGFRLTAQYANDRQQLWIGDYPSADQAHDARAILERLERSMPYQEIDDRLDDSQW